MPGPYPARQIGRLFRRDEREISEKYGEMLAPFFRIEIAGQDERILFSAEAQGTDTNYDLNGLIVSSIEWQENDCQASMMKLTIQNIDMRLHESRMFTEGNTIDLWMGYDGRQPDYMGRGIITAIEPDFSNDSIPTLSVTAYDISHFLMEEGRAEVQAEGTNWWERRRVTPPANPPSQEQQRQQFLVQQQETTAARNRAIREQTQRFVAAGLGQAEAEQAARSIFPETPLSESGATARNVPVRSTTVDTSSAQRTNTPRSRTEIRKVRVPRRRRNRGKVWRNLRDDEIANAIYQSYGIIPYTEAIGGDARSRTVTTELQVQQVTMLDNIPDTDEQGRDNLLRAAAEGLLTARLLESNSRSVDRSGTAALVRREIRAVTRTSERTIEVTQEVGGRRVVQKAGTSDWEFLKKLAKNHGFIMFVFYYYETKSWIGYWGSPHNVPQHVTYDFHYNYREMTTLKSFRPRISTRGQKTEIDMVYTDPATRKRQRLRVAMENISQYSPEFRGPDSTALLDEPLGNGPEVVLTIHGRRTSVQADRNFRSIDDARRWLMSFWYNHASEFCEAEGDFIQGIPELHCRHKHTFDGLTRFDGTYFLTQVTHKMDTGSMYTTTFSGYLMVDMLNNEPEQENGLMSVESENMGELSPQTLDVLERWRRALLTN